MEFTEIRTHLAKHFKSMVAEADCLFEVNLDKEELWNTYLDSFPPGTNEIYRERREHDCSCCRQFIKTIGHTVAVKDGKLMTLWDVQTDDTTYQPVMDALSTFVRSHTISDVYVSKLAQIGTPKTYEEQEGGKVKEWQHFYLDLPQNLVDTSARSKNDIKGSFRDTRQVFWRSLEEISEDSLLTVLELIDSNTLYRGAEWKKVLKEFLGYKRKYDSLSGERERELALWEWSVKVGIAIGRIRNHSIGTLLVNISEGMDLDIAVRKYEQIMAPVNYKRPKAIFTKKMLEEAKKTIEALGYTESLGRRYATLDDITVNHILFSNKDAAKRLRRTDSAGGEGLDAIFGELERKATVNPKKFSRIEEIPIETFISNVLPTASELEVYLEYQHIHHMVSLIAPKNRESKTMFRWGNNFSWAYSGNLTDSMKERVKAAGGRVDGDLRFSIQWNDGDYNPNDFDAHCIEPGGYEIYYPNKQKYSPCKGILDVDIIQPALNVVSVENITYDSRTKMKNGTYRFFVHCYSNRGGRDGFAAEVEFDGQIHSFAYDRELPQDVKIPVAEVTLKDGVFTIKELLSADVSSRELWNLHTNEFVPVSVVMYSPNYWQEQDGDGMDTFGNRHYFFMLKDCINPEQPNGFYNEFLKAELAEHKRVFEALGSQMKVAETADQLSGLGFSSTQRAELIVKVKGKTERVMKVKF
ncbi:MAG: hypothetical protein HFI40_05155 [Lachnospiraceae bacterium]|jgi:hypothetical protein|nr:hypothetical protein [Lachnospiraceae bacterium]